MQTPTETGVFALQIKQIYLVCTKSSQQLQLSIKCVLRWSSGNFCKLYTKNPQSNAIKAEHLFHWDFPGLLQNTRTGSQTKIFHSVVKKKWMLDKRNRVYLHCWDNQSLFNNSHCRIFSVLVFFNSVLYKNYIDLSNISLKL